MKTNNFFRKFVVALGFVLTVVMLYNCEIQDDFSYKKSEYSGELGTTAWEFIQQNDSLNLLEKAIKATQLEGLFENEEEKTFIAPTDDAFKKYLQENSYNSIDEIPDPILLNLLKYHVVNESVIFTDPELSESNSPIAYDTQNGQIMYLSHNTNYEGLINENTSKQFTIRTSNLEATNGIIHVVPSVVYFSAPSTGDVNNSDDGIVRDSIFPIADTYVNGGADSGANFGGNDLLLLKNVEGDGLYDRKPFLMFDLKAFKEEGIITDLKLSLAVSFTHGKGVSIDLYHIQDTTWTEMGLTFDNATFPDSKPIASLISSKEETFEFDITDFYNEVGEKGRMAFMLDAEAGSDETDEFGSKESDDLASPTLVAIMGSGDNELEIGKNNPLNVKKGENAVYDKNILEIEGANANDIIFSIEDPPSNGWLIKGAKVLIEGDKFTQGDINAMNLIYINNGAGTTDEITVSAKDRTGASLESFSLKITID